MTNNPKNFIKFLGTAGARYVTISQKRASGGVWISFEGTNLLIDPGHGSLVRCLESDPRLDPAMLDGIFLTHKHIDHSNDINIMVEAMTVGGSKKKGVVFLPHDMLEGDTIFLNYAQQLPQEIIPLEEKKEYTIGAIHFTVPRKLKHTVETCGVKFDFHGTSISFVVDTGFDREIIQAYKADILVLHTVLVDSLPGIAHLSSQDAKALIQAMRPKQAILTHFGRDFLTQGPEKIAEKLTQEIHVPVTAAFDGMNLTL